MRSDFKRGIIGAIKPVKSALVKYWIKDSYSGSSKTPSRSFASMNFSGSVEALPLKMYVELVLVA